MMGAHSGVEAPDKTGEDTNSNAARACNTGGGWHRNNPVLVKAGADRIETSCVSQGDGISNGFQAPIRLRTNLQRYFPVCARPQQESGMTSMTREQFAEFFRHFGVIREGKKGGAHDVPHDILMACFDTWVEDETLDPIYDYERARFGEDLG
jgi:hypothetical protein